MSWTVVFELVGVAGIAVGVLAYLPQLIHLARERCSAGISIRAWAMWLASSVLVGSLALYRADLVFIALQASSAGAATVVVLLARRYRGMVCETHAPARRGRRAEATIETASSSTLIRW